MDPSDTFTLIPLTLDPQTKLISVPKSSSSTLPTELSALNTLHKSLVTLDTPNQAPPPPTPIKPNLSQQIQKLKDSANTILRKGPSSAQEAVRQYSLAITMAQSRPVWEPAQLVREECAMLYSNRSQAYLTARDYANAYIDAELSLECKRGGNAKAHWRAAKALVEMGRSAEAKERVDAAAEVEEGALVQARAQLEQIKNQIRAMEAQIQAQGQGQVPPQAHQQAKAVEEAVKVQEDGVRELREMGRELDDASQVRKGSIG